MQDNMLSLYLVGNLAGMMLEFISRFSNGMKEFLAGLEASICSERIENNGG